MPGFLAPVTDLLCFRPFPAFPRPSPCARDAERWLLSRPGRAADRRAFSPAPAPARAQGFDSYEFEAKSWRLVRWHFCSIDTWLEARPALLCRPPPPKPTHSLTDSCFSCLSAALPLSMPLRLLPGRPWIHQLQGALISSKEPRLSP